VISTDIIKVFIGDLPAVVIVLLIEHIAISKSFGRVNNYTINPSQELVAIGLTNILGPFLGAYPATGSFSRSAIKSLAGVRTPFAGFITAVIVLLAIYALPAVFFYIPNASLAAVIIHAVGDLITAPNVLYQFWRVAPLDVPIFFAGVLVTVFSSIENGIYTTICVSFAVLVYRLLRAKGRFLGKAKVQSVAGEHVLGADKGVSSNDDKKTDSTPTFGAEDATSRNIFLPFDHGDGSNPEIPLSNPGPGVFIYRFSEGFNYPNANHYLDHLTSTIFEKTRKTNTKQYARPGDRPWNDPGPRRGQAEDFHLDRPTLKAIILDFSSVNNVDSTSIQILIDVRNQLDKYAAPGVVDWHFACINNRWTKRALVNAGFGYPTIESGADNRWKSIFSVAEIGGSLNSSAAGPADEKGLRARQTERSPSVGNDDINRDSESGRSYEKEGAKSSAKVAVVTGLNRPLFHADLTSALQSAVANAQAKEAIAQEIESRGGESTGVEP
jgi:sodium-independent sulfate anion transporter 11